MKKYLMTGVAALAICAAFTSCSKSGDDIYNPEAAGQMKADQITQAYNEAFIKYVGGPIASNQDWGFSSAGTRSVIKQDMTERQDVTPEDTDYDAFITNNPGVELPFTGGPGTFIYTLSGITLLMASALMYIFRMRRRERRLK